MKRSIQIFTVLLNVFIFSSVLLQGQTRSWFTKPSPPEKAEKEVISKQSTRNQVKLNEISRIASKAMLEEIDTLNFPLAGTYELYYADGGFVAGNNIYNDLAKANYFEFGQQALLTGILIDFSYATNTNSNIEIAVWNNSGSNTPGTKLGSAFEPLDDIFLDVLNDQTTYVEFDPPVAISGSFYAGIMIPQIAGDTIAVFTNTDGDTSPPTAWEQLEGGNWLRFDDAGTWGLDVALAVFPIVSYSTELTANFIASSTTVLAGSDVSFTDLSFGNPISWSWTFEGGTPPISTEQNPVVTYNGLGTFDVSLQVSDGSTTDMLVMENYINVVDEIPLSVDTLFWLMPGEYTVYFLNGGGGYVCGNNVYNDQAKANFFDVNFPCEITGILYDFAWATSNGDPSIEIAVWNNNGDGGAPGTQIMTINKPISTIINNINEQELTFAEFSEPLSINHPFYAGVNLPQTPGDTIVLWSNTHQNITPGVAWEQWEDNQWLPMNMFPSWELDIVMGVHPIIEYYLGTDENQNTVKLTIYPNPVKDRIRIDLDIVSANTQYQILNLEGKLLKSGTLIRTGEIDVQDLEAGTFLLRIIAENLEYSSKVILTH